MAQEELYQGQIPEEILDTNKFWISCKLKEFPLGYLLKYSDEKSTHMDVIDVVMLQKLVRNVSR